MILGYFTWSLITFLGSAFGLTLGTTLWFDHKAECYKRNQILLEHHRQGPLQEC